MRVTLAKLRRQPSTASAKVRPSMADAAANSETAASRETLHPVVLQSSSRRSSRQGYPMIAGPAVRPRAGQVEFADLGLGCLFRLGVGAERHHPALACHRESNPVRREVFGATVDFGPLATVFNGDGELHSLARLSGQILCKFCAES